MKSKFIKALPELVKKEVITEEVSNRIIQYYSNKKIPQTNRLMTVFGVLGSILIGLGIILIVAHNWDNLSKSIKAVLAFIPLIIWQLAVGYSIFKKKSTVWKEASGTFLFFAVGSSMALISQVYNIPGDFTSYLLTWVMLCIPLTYLLKSNALWILSLVLISNYACNLGFSSQNIPWMYLVGLISILPYYLIKIKEDNNSNMITIMNWLLPLSLIIVLGSFIKTEWEMLPVLYMLLFSLLYGIGSMIFFKNGQLRKNGYLVLGSIGAIVMLLMFSFKWIWEEFVESINFYSEEFIIATLLFTIGALVFGYNCTKNKLKEVNLFACLSVLFPILIVIGIWSNDGAVVTSNVLVFLLGITAIRKGVNQFHFGILNYGLVIISSLIVCRFFDMNISFEIRGLLFVLMGVGFFVANYTILKLNSKKDNK